MHVYHTGGLLLGTKRRHADDSDDNTQSHVIQDSDAEVTDDENDALYRDDPPADNTSSENDSERVISQNTLLQCEDYDR